MHENIFVVIMDSQKDSNFCFNLKQIYQYFCIILLFACELPSTFEHEFKISTKKSEIISSWYIWKGFKMFIFSLKWLDQKFTTTNDIFKLWFEILDKGTKFYKYLYVEICKYSPEIEYTPLINKHYINRVILSQYNMA